MSAALVSNESDRLISDALERIGGAYAALRPFGCPVDDPRLQRAEAVVDAAYLAEDLAELKAAVREYEQCAGRLFAQWAVAHCQACGRSWDVHGPCDMVCGQVYLAKRAA